MPHRCLALLSAVLLAVLLGTPAPARAEDPAPSEEERQKTRQLVAELRAETAEIRGLPWKQEIEADLLTRAQVRTRLTEQIKKELPKEELERMTRIIHRLGLLPKDQDPLQLALDMITAMAGGFYDPDEKQLYLIAGQDPSTLKPVIVHELLHALEDQYIDLKARHEALKNDTDGMFAFKCVVEGSAETCRLAYEDRNPEASLASAKGQAANTEAAEGQRKILKTVPAFLMVDTLLHYRIGPAFVGRAIGDGSYPERIQALYESGPTTQEQVIHPERWLGTDRDLPQRVEWAMDLEPLLGGGWEKLEDQTQGELDIAVLLDFFLGPDGGKLKPEDMGKGQFVDKRARIAAAGWDGGRVRYMAHGEHIGIVGAYAFDTAEDQAEAATAFRQMVETMHGAAFAAAPERNAVIPDEGFHRGSDHATVLHYTGAHGMGLLASRGTNLFWADGFTLRELLDLGRVLAATQFHKDPADRFDVATGADPLADCTVVDRERGVGLVVPEGSGWVENTAMRQMLGQQDPFAFTVMQKDGTVVILRLIGSGVPKAQHPVLLGQLSQQLGAGPYDESKRSDARMGGFDGSKYDAGLMQVRLASNGLATFMAMVRGAPADEAGNAAIDELLAGLKVVIGY